MKLIKPVWLISEHGNDARDNGYAFFCYMRQKHKEICCIYVCDKNNEKDYQKAKHRGAVIQFRSLLHKFCYLLSDRIITSHVGDSEPWEYPRYLELRKNCPFLFRKEKIVFLQHGVIFNDVKNVYAKSLRPVDFFVCTTEREKELVKRTLGYTDAEARITGLARFDDYCHAGRKRQILLMPTWRFSFGKANMTSKHITEDALKRKFRHSAYYKGLQALLDNRQLSEILEKYDYTFVFYPHYEMQMYLDCFHIENPRIRFGDIFNDSAHRLLKESALLITDYSSVAFDYGYMNRPLIYYHFDSDNNGSESYSNREFNYETQGFGPVCHTPEKTAAAISEILKNQCRNPIKYENRADAEFRLRDRHNCDRIFKEIKNL